MFLVQIEAFEKAGVCASVEHTATDLEVHISVCLIGGQDDVVDGFVSNQSHHGQQRLELFGVVSDRAHLCKTDLLDVLDHGFTFQRFVQFFHEEGVKHLLSFGDLPTRFGLLRFELFIYDFLLSFYVFEHVLALLSAHPNERGKHFVVCLVKVAGTRQPILNLSNTIKPLQVLRLIIKDQVVLEDADKVARLIVHDVCGDLRMKKVFSRQVLHIQNSLRHCLQAAFCLRTLRAFLLDQSLKQSLWIAFHPQGLPQVVALGSSWLLINVMGDSEHLTFKAFMAAGRGLPPRVLRRLA